MDRLLTLFKNCRHSSLYLLGLLGLVYFNSQVLWHGAGAMETANEKAEQEYKVWFDRLGTVEHVGPVPNRENNPEYLRLRQESYASMAQGFFMLTLLALLTIPYSYPNPDVKPHLFVGLFFLLITGAFCYGLLSNEQLRRVGLVFLGCLFFAALVRDLFHFQPQEDGNEVEA